MTNNDILEETALVLERSADAYESGEIQWVRFDEGDVEDEDGDLIPVDDENIVSSSVRCLCISSMLQRQARLMVDGGEADNVDWTFLDSVADIEFMFSIYDLFPHLFGNCDEDEDEEGLEPHTIQQWNDDFANGKHEVISVCRAASQRLRLRGKGDD